MTASIGSPSPRRHAGSSRSRNKNRIPLSPTFSLGTSSKSNQFKERALPGLNVPRQDCSSIVVDLQLDTDPDSSDSCPAVVTVGGRNALNPSLDSVELLDWNTMRRWWTLPSLNSGRYGCAIAALNGSIYVIGGWHHLPPVAPAHTNHHPSQEGQTQNSCLASVECYTYTRGAGEAQDWIEMEPMHTPRWYATAVAIPSQSKLFVLGGRDSSWEELDTLEIYHPADNTWNPAPQMSNKRFAFAAVLYNERVLVFGGYNGQEWTSACEALDIDTMQWSAVPNMPKAVQFGVAAVSGNHIVIRGQTADQQVLWQAYDPIQNCWRLLRVEANYLVMGATISSVGSRILVIGGAEKEDMEPTTFCNQYSMDLEALFHSLPTNPAILRDEEESVANSSYQPAPTFGAACLPLPAEPPNPTASRDPEASEHSERSNTSQHSGSGRHKVIDSSLKDNFGSDVTFTGYLAANDQRPQGKGRMVWTVTGDKYEGSFERGSRQGRGRMLYANGDSFEGWFQRDIRQGKGVYLYRDGRRYEGNYMNDLPEDTEGHMVWKDGTTYVGHFKASKRTGKGRLTFPKNNVSYEGDFVNGKYHGYGTCSFADGSVYVGQWRKGKANGQGRLTDKDGTVVHDGQWIDDGPR